MEQYSDELIERMVAYALKKYNLRITKDEAVEYLRSLAGGFLAFAKIEARKHKPKPKQENHES
jgi:hypothetical protein